MIATFADPDGNYFQLMSPMQVVLDMHMPDGGGRRVIHAVHAEQPGIRFLALSVSDAAEDVIDVIRAGADSTPVCSGSYVVKPRL